MGYYTYFSGDLTITPIPTQMPAPEEIWDGDEKAYFGYFRFEEIDDGNEDVAVVDGEIKVVGQARNHLHVTQFFDDSVKAYDYPERLRDLVNWATAQGCHVEGTIYANGEEDGDFSRYRVNGGTIDTEVPQYLWPNGDVTRIG